MNTDASHTLQHAPSAQTLAAAGLLSLQDNFYPEAHELLEQLKREVVWDERMHSRSAASFGAPYNYSGIEWPEVPFPNVLLRCLDRLEHTLGYRSNNCLAHLYRDGNETLGFHSDATTNLVEGSGIAVVSLGATRRISFRKLSDKTTIEHYELRAGSLLFMTLELQHGWKHAILPDPTTQAERVSLAFRRMR